MSKLENPDNLTTDNENQEDSTGHIASRMRFEAERCAAENEARDITNRARGRVAIATPKKKVDTAAIESAVCTILEAIGEDTTRSGIRDTPQRVARFWRDFIEYAPGTTDTTFDQEIVADQMVAVSGMRVWSLCEHHLLPFYTDISCGYIANGRVLGLSKFARIAHLFAHRLQTQENMATEIADEIERITESRNVAVLCANGMHTCMTMRGIKTQGSMSNAVMRGVFRLRPTAREEFYNLINRSH